MCLIVDANLCSVLFKKTSDVQYKQLRQTITSNRVTLIFGGKLTQEYITAGAFKLISELSRNGRAIKVADKAIDAQLLQIKGKCKSNDEHVIALARADRKRGHVLCTNDLLLQADFKDKSLIDLPRGTIYSPSRHKASLANC